MEDIIRKYVRILLEKEEDKSKELELITEPDEADGDEEEEASFGGVAGVTVPLGAGPHYPNRRPEDDK